MKIGNLIKILILCLGGTIQAQDNFVYKGDCERERGEIREGRLDNGLVYFVNKNEDKEGKTEIRLCVRVGSGSEKKGEEGVAHFLEHLAFDGSGKYPNDTSVKYWERLGAKYGFDINAYTGYDRTVYMLSLPIDKTSDSVEKSIEIFGDWLENLLLSEEDIEKQKKIIKQEIGGYEIPEDLDNIKRGKDEKFRHLPIGSVEDVFKIKRETLLRFYKKWYNTGNAGVVVVGDVDLERTEGAIKRVFGKMKSWGARKGDVKELRFDNVFQNIKGKGDKVVVCFGTKYKRNLDKEDMLGEYKKRVGMRMVKNRLERLGIKCYISSYWYLEGSEFLEISFEDKGKDFFGIGEGISVIEGLKKGGVTEREVREAVDRIKKEVIGEAENKVNREIADKVCEMIVFREKGIMCKDLAGEINMELEKISAEEWREEICNIFSYKGKMLVIYHGDKGITYEDVKREFEKGKEKADTRLGEEKKEEKDGEKVKTKLYDRKEFKEEMITGERYFGNIGVREVTLSNGVKLYFKKVEGEKKTKVSVVCKGGLNRLKPNEFKEMEDMIAYVGMWGSEGLKGDDFSKLLYEQGLSYLVTNENYWHGAIGEAGEGKEGLLARVMVDKILHPEIRKDEFEEIKRDELEGFREEGKENEEQEMDFVKEELVGNIFRKYRENKSRDEIGKMDVEKMMAYYKENYINSEEISVFVVGDFDEQEVKRDFASGFVEIPKNVEGKSNDFDKYVESIPFEKREIKFLTGKENDRISFKDIYYGKMKGGLKEELLLKVCREIMHKRVLEELREKGGVSYSPYVELNVRALPEKVFFFGINGESNKDNLLKIREGIERAINDLKRMKVSDDEVEGIKRMFLENRKIGLVNNMQWLEYLQSMYKGGIKMEEVDNYEAMMNELKAGDVESFFRDNIRGDYSIFLLSE